MKRLMLTICALMALSASAEDPYLAENLTVWLRADKGLTTNAVGGVTAWANQGTNGAVVDVVPHADNSAGHVVYEASGIGGKPSLAFDGEVYLKTAAAADLGVTAAGGAWFVVFKTPCPRVERANMGIMGSVPGQRFGAFFANDGTESYYNFFFGGINALTATSNKTQIASAMCWKEGNTSRAYAMNLWTLGSVVAMNPSPGSAVFMVGNMIPSWMPTFKGEIAEIRIYNRALTGRERARIQLDLCARYGVQWQGHGNILDNNALRCCANSVLLDGISDDGVPEEVISSGETGGLSLSLDNPSAMNDANAYFTHDDNEGLARRWYFSAWARTMAGSGLTLAFDIPASFATTRLDLLYAGPNSFSWTKLAATGSYENGRLVFHLPAGSWQNGWYRLGSPTLSAWYRADAGVVTNAAGKIERWKNIGVASAFMTIDLVPTNETSHVALSPDAANGRPAAQFNGEGFLRATAEAVFHKTALKPNPANENDKYTVGTAWLVVFKPCADVVKRRNMAPFMLPNASAAGNRCGLFFYYDGNGRQLQAYVYDNAPTTINASDDWQIVSFARWARTSDLASMGQAFVNGVASGGVRGPIWVGAWSAKIHMGHMGLYWGVPFEGDIAELQIYNAPLTATERALTEISLATHYGISVTTAGINGVPPADYQQDACVFNGKFLDSPDLAPTNAVSGELTITCIEETEQTPDLVTFVGHDESAWFAPARAKGRAERSWFVSSGASNKAHRFEFSGVNAAQGYRMKLSYRPNLESAWQTIATSTGQATFDVPSLQRGFYTMEVSPGGLSIISR